MYYDEINTFRKGIEVYARQITAELLDVQLSFVSGRGCICPKCKTGRILFYPKVAKCSNVDQGQLKVFRINFIVQINQRPG